MYNDKDYSFLSKILHHLALRSNFIPEFLHDVELFIFKKKLKIDNSKQHLFICGLPRSGTTILMRALYETKKFASLTYRDMPFVFMPNIWSKISSRFKSSVERKRIHDDDILINIDSPEALEEIFWRIKLKNQYIYSDKLKTHKVDSFTLSEFRNFISLILYKYKKKNYLSKNNNNILRIESLIECFPNSTIIIPFRDPLQHANSLLRQHKNFTKIQKENKFIKNYMSYLSHYEFGIIHRPYFFSEDKSFDFDQNSLKYWLNLWINVYKNLLENKISAKKNIVYLNYEYFCNNSKIVLENILNKISLNSLPEDYKFEVKQPIKKETYIDDEMMLEEAKKVFNDLKLLGKI